jgi:hypothetical protein
MESLRQEVLGQEVLRQEVPATSRSHFARARRSSGAAEGRPQLPADQ